LLTECPEKYLITIDFADNVMLVLNDADDSGNAQKLLDSLDVVVVELFKDKLS
jgi:hypothetical protein